MGMGGEPVSVVAVDPGFEKSAVVVMTPLLAVEEHLTLKNEEMLSFLRTWADGSDVLVIEQVASFGMPVGAEVFETVFWSGRFAQAWPGTWKRMKRHEVKMALCRTASAKDANIRQALIDRFGPGKEKAVGRKANRGPLYGIHGDEWSALAVAVAFLETGGGG